MIKDPLKVAIVQYNCSSDKKESLQRLLEMVRKAAQKSELVLLAEVVFAPYTTTRNFAEVAEKIPGEFTRSLSQIAREKRVYICSGMAEREGDALYNTAVLVNAEGEISGKYRKTALAEGDTRGGFQCGTGPKVIHTPLGKIGILICWDTQNLSILSSLALEKPDLILVPCYGLAKVDHSRKEFIDCMVDECIEEWRLRMQTVAKICDAYVLRADHCGMEERQVRVGHSIAVSPGGYVISEATMHPQILEVTLHRSAPEQSKMNCITV